ncbi:UNVERIFIED_CONTAM: hypothetical protein RMT77_001949 [Armadillidium vulgare]
MSILNSCCCWKSIRRACYACAIYSLVYFAGMFAIIWKKLEKPEDSDGEHESVLVQEPPSPESWMNHLLKIFLGLSIVGCGTSIFLIIGVWKDKKLLLIPWIIVMTLIILFDIAYVVILAYEESMSLKPEVAMVLTADFFALILNIYALLCVVSQFQEFVAGRGRAEDENPQIGVALRYSKSVPTLSVETGRKNMAGLDSKIQTNGISPRQNRLSFRNPSIKINRTDKGHLRDHPEATVIESAINKDVPIHTDDIGFGFARSDCIRIPSSNQAKTDVSLTREEAKRIGQFSANVRENKLSTSEPGGETSETSATTECDSSSGRDWTNDKNIEHSPLLSLSDTTKPQKF